MGAVHAITVYVPPSTATNRIVYVCAMHAICCVVELVEGVAQYLVTCQTYEGGFGGEPDNEAHGGYNFCALAALHILGEVGTRSAYCGSNAGLLY